MSQTKEVLNHLINLGTITSIEAIKLYGATRLSAIIFELRKKHDIETEMIEVTTRYGRKTKVGRYIYFGLLDSDIQKRNISPKKQNLFLSVMKDVCKSPSARKKKQKHRPSPPSREVFPRNGPWPE